MRRAIILILTVILGLTTSLDAQHIVRATKYYGGIGCGMITASGSRINNQRVNDFKDRWIALSQDMFKLGYKFNDTIYVESDVKALEGKWVVKDKMGKKMKKSIDFLMTKGNSKTFRTPCKVKIRKINSKKK